MQEFLHGEDSLSVLVSQASHFLRDVLWVGLDLRGLTTLKLFLQVSLLLGIEPVAWLSRLPTSPSLWQARGATVYL